MDTDEGRRNRRLWFQERYSDKYNASQKTDFRSNLPNHAAVLAPDCLSEVTQIIVWHGDNAHEQTGLRYAMFRLRQAANEIRLLNTYGVHASLFDRPDWKVAFSHSGEISPDKLMPMLAKALEGPALAVTERDRLAREWSQWENSNETLRIWRDGNIFGVPESHYDELLLRTVGELQRTEGEWVCAARAVGELLGQDESFAGDGFFEYRLRSLIRSGELDSEGSLAGMGGYLVRPAQ
ncbi:DUF1835 domain-containing protein [Cohnella sp. CBP 2801]|uniref:DUF1835 domain-containing protein n=1 Tax=Cohnella zeiphila TaxID=2761120 RepID=A0A7X0VZ57_9BACL|nr:DUF1835 domain-containing protein [Cohnella zeiphila]